MKLIALAVSEIQSPKVSVFFLRFFFFSSSSSSFRTNYKIGSNSRTRFSIQLTVINRIKASSGSNFGENRVKVYGVITVYSRKQRSNFRHAYRVNRFEKQAENWFVAGLNIGGVPFGG